jgi:hypothetical protein
MNNNVTCNPTQRDEIIKLFNYSAYGIDLFMCGTDIDNSFGGKYKNSMST